MDTHDERAKLSPEEQIQHMISKGIQFNIIDEDAALTYLTQNTYYFKLKEYAKLYEKYKFGDNNGKYVDLEFAYLKDLATIDSLLRKKILLIALDIEHYLKVALLDDFNRSNEDGYSIIKDFIAFDPDKWEKEFEQKKHGKACSNLINKYRDNFAIWNFVEILSFSDLENLYSFFYIRNADQLFPQKAKNPRRQFKGPYFYYLNPVRVLRNAAAHSNCLISSLRNPYISKEEFNNNPYISAFLGKRGVKNRTLNTQLEKPLIHDFCVMLYLYHKVAPKNVQKYVFEDLKCFFEHRVVDHKENYCNKNAILCSAYEFVKRVIDIFYDEVKSND